MTGPSAPDPAVETVLVLAEHQYGGMQDVHDNLICSCGLICHDFPVHQTAVVVAALRAAAGTVDVDDLAEVAGRAMCDARTGRSIADSDWAEVRDVWVTAEMTAAVRAVLDRLAVTGAAPVPVVAGDEAVEWAARRPRRPTRRGCLVNAVDERAALLRLAEEADDPVDAVAALLLGHDRPASISWVCGCGLVPRPGDSHAKHQADAVLGLLRRRGWTS